MVLAHVRHRYTDYDARLVGASQEEHDRLRAVMDAACYKKFVWLRSDPIPLPPDPVRKFMDELSASICELKDSEHELVEALRSPGGKVHREFITECLIALREEIRDKTEMLTRPQITAEGINFVFMPNPTGEYFWFGIKLYPNRTVYRGFQCPECGAGVYGTKQPLSLGQGKKWIVNSCLCLVEYGPASPDGRKTVPTSLKSWQHGLEKDPEPTPTAPDQSP
jgi:hypothetical protein